MVQVPAPTIDALDPEIVQTFGVDEVNVTARPELAVAESVTGDAPNVTPATGDTLTVYGACVTVKLCITLGAGG